MDDAVTDRLRWPVSLRAKPRGDDREGGVVIGDVVTDTLDDHASERLLGVRRRVDQLRLERRAPAIDGEDEHPTASLANLRPRRWHPKLGIKS